MLSQTCEYALRAVACLARQPGEFVTASALADATAVPSDYLSKVLQQLASAGVVQGRRGVGGGYRLARDPRDINLHDIIDAMGMITRMRACPSADSRDNTCPLHDTMDRAIKAAEQVFRDTTLANLVAQDEKSSMCIKRTDTVASTNNHANHAQPARTTVSARAGSSANLREERFARSASTPSRPADEDFDSERTRARADEGPVYTASGKLRAKPRLGANSNGNGRH